MRLVIPLMALIGCAETASLEADSFEAAPAAGSATGCDYAAQDVGPEFSSGTLDVGQALSALGTREETLVWDGRGEQATLWLTADDPTSYRYVSSDNPDCGDFLLVDLTVTLVTDDGHLDEVFEASLRHDGGPVLRLERWIALDQLVGDWDPSQLDPAKHTAADVEVVANLSSGGSSGELALYATRVDGGTDAWDVARWPAP